MMKKLVTILLAVLLLVSLSSVGFAADIIQQKDQMHLQDRDQTCIDDATKDQACDQLRDRLHVTDNALVAQQERAQGQSQNQNRFSDMQQHWARETVMSAYNWGLVNGYPDGNFQPNGDITGTEGILMVSRAMNCVAGLDETDASEDDVNWDDVPLWAREQLREQTALRIAAQSQLYGENQLNRLQFVVMVAKAMGVEPIEVPEDTVVFLDQDEIPAELLGYVYAMRTLGIIQGNNGNFYANQYVTRAEAVTILARVMNILD